MTFKLSSPGWDALVPSSPARTVCNLRARANLRKGAICPGAFSGNTKEIKLFIADGALRRPAHNFRYHNSDPPWIHGEGKAKNVTKNASILIAHPHLGMELLIDLLRARHTCVSGPDNVDGRGRHAVDGKGSFPVYIRK